MLSHFAIWCRTIISWRPTINILNICRVFLMKPFLIMALLWSFPTIVRSFRQLNVGEFFLKHYFQAFTWRDLHSENPLHRDSRCELDINMPSLESNNILEVYGRNSSCFDLSAPWTVSRKVKVYIYCFQERRCSRVKTYNQFLAGCYAVCCFFNGSLNINPLTPLLYANFWANSQNQQRLSMTTRRTFVNRT